MTCQPKKKGGLGILDLERFARALRLRWLWFQWKHRERAWNGLDLPVDSRDRDLFAASTEVTIGDGNRASFWQSSWVDGRTPKKHCSDFVQEGEKEKPVGKKSYTR